MAELAKVGQDAVDPTKKVQAIIDTVAKGIPVASEAFSLLEKIRKGLLAMSSEHALIINQDPNPNRVVTFYMYNTGALVKLTSQFTFTSKHGIINEVYCPAMGTGFKGMKVFVDNKQPGWGIMRGQVYVFDGSSFNPIMSKEEMVDKMKNLDSMHQKAADAVQKMPETPHQPVAETAHKAGGKAPARMEYDDHYGAYAFGGDNMAPYVQPIAGGYDQYGYSPQLLSQPYGQYGSEWMGVELLFAGVLGVLLLAICAVIVCVVGAITGAAVRHSTVSRQRTKRYADNQSYGDEEDV